MAALIVLAGSACGRGESRPTAKERAACAHPDRLSFSQHVECQTLGLLPRYEPPKAPAGFNAPWAGMTRVEVRVLARREIHVIDLGSGRLGRASFFLAKRMYHGHRAWLIKYDKFCEDGGAQPLTYVWRTRGGTAVEKQFNDCG
jgi:hypothetical protein